MINDQKLLYNPQLRTDSSRGFLNKKLPIGVVDEIADRLVTEYGNRQFRRWYCGVVYQFGPNKVYEWQARAKEGKDPARLFSKYVKDARVHCGTLRVRL